MEQINHFSQVGKMVLTYFLFGNNLKYNTMKTETREIYKCEHCNKLYQRKSFAIKHEIACSKNPENKRACLDGCEFLTKKDTKVYIGIEDCHSGEPIYESRSLCYCSKKEVFLYPPKVEHKGNAYTEFYDEEKENNPMPIECKDFKFYGLELWDK